MENCEELRLLVGEFIRFLDKEEESDSGTRFRPNQINSCRVMDGLRMGKILERMKILSHDTSCNKSLP